MINKILNNFYNVALLFILMFANLLIITSALFLIKIPITICHLPASLILGTIELKLIRKENIKNIIVSLITFIIIFSISCLLCGHIYDDSADGNEYHKFAIGLLKNEWNPIYDSQEKIIKKLNLDAEENLWVEHYPKATWIYGANIYKLTNNIETAKTFNLMAVFTLFFTIIYLINKFYQKKLIAIILAIAACTFPII